MESRSSTGCSTCKTRRKKCDETYPRCQRCTKSGIECGGYEYLKPKGGKSTRRRIVPGSKSSRLATQADQIVLASRPSGDACIPDTLLSTASALEPMVLASSSAIGPWIHSSTDRLGALEPQLPGSSRSSRSPYQEFDVISTPGCSGYTCWQTAPVSHQDPNDIQPPIRSHMSTPQGITPTQPQQDLSSSLFSISKASPEERQPTSQQAGLYWEFSSFDRLQPLPPESSHVFQSSASTGGSYWPLPETEVGEDETHDPEGIRELWISIPAIDSTVPSNLLAFVLQSYGNWMALTAFDPTRMVHRVKEALVQQIESSNTARTRVWLISTAMGTLNNVSLLDPKAGELISMLAGSIHQAASSYKSSPPTHAPGVDRRKASSALDNILEIMALQAYAKPFSTILSLLASAAPAFRRACPGPLDTLVNLANILLEPKFNLRHFAFFDVVLGVVTGRPMHFRYDVEFSIELCNQINSVDKEFGLEWMHGTPDQFILLFAWMNGLREDCCAGAGPVSSEAIVRIEQYLRDLTFTLGLSETPDPVLRIGRLVVQECWRQAAYVYLYMGLCGANNQDSRVTKAFLGFMRLINGVKPGRFPDAYLIIPWIILGMASTQTQCRETIRRRLSSRPECWNPAASGCDILRMLDNVWARSEAEGRPIVWDDLRIACFRVTGM